ncbi:MAG TPA: TIGR03557 family F420-dependent LLM class oxidoreductase, partial [Acidimicrobiia bacterium]|nr:TIGR03557 family F420-dependent LLM class oxidoreductase [Acidimicrobiia bacterium]
SEEHPPLRLVEIAELAERTGLDFVAVSDHFHPWIDDQGHAPFVWSVLGAIADRTERIEVGVGVTCPIMRIHPAILAQAVATTSLLFEGRFVWGVGTGEALNEHVLGDRWPPAPQRLDMLEEALDVIRALWTGESTTYRGEYYTVEDARIFDLPKEPIRVLVSAFGEKSAELAARVGDGLWITGIKTDVIETYRSAGGSGDVWTQLTFCWDDDEQAALERAHRVWPNTGLPGQLAQDLRTVEHMEQATSLVTEEQLAESMAIGPDPEPILKSINEAQEAGIEYIYLHQVGDPLDGFLEFWSDELQPQLQ